MKRGGEHNPDCVRCNNFDVANYAQMIGSNIDEAQVCFHWNATMSATHPKKYTPVFITADLSFVRYF